MTEQQILNFLYNNSNLVFGKDYEISSDYDEIIPLTDEAKEALDNIAMNLNIDDIDFSELSNIDINQDYSSTNDTVSESLLEYAIGTGYTREQALDFFKRHPEFIGCEKNSNKLYELGKVLENEKFGNPGDEFESFNEDPEERISNSDYIGLSEEEVNDLDSRGAAVKIVNKWLCRALEKNDGKAVREACIVLKSIEKK